MATAYRAFAVAAPGLESIVADELRAMGTEGQLRDGGVELACTRDALWRVVSEARTPESVRVRVARFRASSFSALESGTARVAWHAWLHATPEVRVVCHKSALYHSAAVAERVSAAIGDRGAHSAPPLVHVRLHHDVCSLSVEATGAPAHRRGVRTHVVEGMMRETLAAACVRASGLDTARALWDPFCGAGTFALEWLATVAGVPPFGTARTFAMEHWPAVRDLPRPRSWDAGATLATGATWFGSDLSARAADAAAANVAQAGVATSCRIWVGDFEAAARDVPEGTSILTNLPYGKRVPVDVHGLARRLGGLLRARGDLRPAAFVHAQPDLDAALGLPLRRLASFSNRGLGVFLSRVEPRG